MEAEGGIRFRVAMQKETAERCKVAVLREVMEEQQVLVVGLQAVEYNTGAK